MKAGSNSALYRDFWAELKGQLELPSSPLPGAPMKVENSTKTVCYFQWIDDVKLEGWLNITSNATRVQIALFGTGAARRFDRLHAQKRTIERDLGERLVWRDPRHDPEKLRATNATYFIQTRDQPCQPSDRGTWPLIQAWLATRLRAFHAVFSVPGRLDELRRDEPK